MGRQILGYFRRHHLALAAIFLALGGTAWAVATIGPRDIERDAVRAKHVKDGAIGTGEVAGNSLTGGDIDESTLNVSDANACRTEGVLTLTEAQTQVLCTSGPLTVRARCNQQIGLYAQLLLETTADNSWVGTVGDLDPDFDGGEEKVSTITADSTANGVGTAGVTENIVMGGPSGEQLLVFGGARANLADEGLVNGTCEFALAGSR